MHARKTHTKWPQIFASLIAMAIFIGLMPASANSTVDVNGQQLSFDNAKFFDGTSLGALVTQRDQDNSNSLDMGVNAEVGGYLNYYNVITVGGVQVDARMTFLSELDLEGDFSALSQVEEMDEAYSDPGENKWINLGIDFVDGDDDSYGEFKIEFFTDIDGAATPVTLRNVKMSTYDIDGTQYVEVSDFNRYLLSTNTILTVSQPRAGITRFAETSDASTSGADSLTKTRVSVEFDSLSSLIFRVGKQALPGNPDTGSASFSVDFSIGQDWGVADGSSHKSGSGGPHHS